MNLSSFSLFCGQTNFSGYVLTSKSQTHPLTGKQIQMRYTSGTHEVLDLNGSVRGTVFLVTDFMPVSCPGFGSPVSLCCVSAYTAKPLFSLCFLSVARAVMR